MSIIRESSSGYAAFAEEDILLTARKIFLTEGVNSVTSAKLIKELMALDEEGTDEITIFINSPGGEVLSGLAVYDFIKTMKSPVRTVCIGTCYSMGAILFLAGTHRQVYEHSMIMIHAPAYSTNDIGGKKAHEIQQEVDKLAELGKILAQIIADVTGKSVEEISEITSHDAFYNAREALEFGLATEIINN